MNLGNIFLTWFGTEELQCEFRITILGDKCSKAPLRLTLGGS